MRVSNEVGATRRIFLQQSGPHPADLRMITIDDDSMEPLLSSGGRILIDVRQRIPVPPGIFLIWDKMGLVAKRIELPKGLL